MYKQKNTQIHGLRNKLPLRARGHFNLFLKLCFILFKQLCPSSESPHDFVFTCIQNTGGQLKVDALDHSQPSLFYQRLICAWPLFQF